HAGTRFACAHTPVLGTATLTEQRILQGWRLNTPGPLEVRVAAAPASIQVAPSRPRNWSLMVAPLTVVQETTKIPWPPGQSCAPPVAVTGGPVALSRRGRLTGPLIGGHA